MAKPVPAPHGRRIMAYLIDGAVVLVLLLLASPLLGLGNVDERDRVRGAVLVYAVVAALHAAYIIPSWGLAGASLGKWICGLRVVGAHGRPPGIGRASLRWIVMLLLSWPLGVAWWPVLFRSDRRGLHDLASVTRVVGREPD